MNYSGIATLVFAMVVALIGVLLFQEEKKTQPGSLQGNSRESSSDLRLTICTAFSVIATLVLALVTWYLKISTDNIYLEEKIHATEDWMREIHRVEEKVEEANKRFPTTRECERYLIMVDADPKKDADLARDNRATGASLLEAVVEDERLPPPGWSKQGDMLEACLMGIYVANPMLQIQSVNEASKFLFIREEIDDYLNVMQNWADVVRNLPDEEIFEQSKSKFVRNVAPIDIKYLELVVKYLYFRSHKNDGAADFEKIAYDYSSLCQPFVIRHIKLKVFDCVTGRIFN